MPEQAPVIVSLPVGDRPTSSTFYRGFLDQQPPGEPRDDGEPEPLQFLVNDGMHLMLVPRGGFDWVIGDDHQVAEPGVVEVVLSRSAGSEAEVQRLAEVALRSGGSVVEVPDRKPWGYVALVADPDGHVWQLIAD